MAQHDAVLSHTTQHFQGAVPDSRAAFTGTSPGLVLATGAQRAGSGIASAWHSHGPHGYREDLKYPLKGQRFPSHRYFGYFIEIWGFPA